jgi:hypothetical protein
MKVEDTTYRLLIRLDRLWIKLLLEKSPEAKKVLDYTHQVARTGISKVKWPEIVTLLEAHGV